MRQISRIFLCPIAICAFLHGTNASAQPVANDSSIRVAAINNTTREYQRFASVASPLYFGPQYVEYAQQINQGHPFFLNTDFNNGSIVYDHILYENIPLKYDILLNRIVVRDAIGVYSFCPLYDKISSFTIKDHEFIKLEKDSSNPSLPRSGFYEIFYKSKRLTVLKKETKAMMEDLNDKSGARRYIVPTIHFYVRKGNEYFLFNRKKQVLALFKDRKAELRQFIQKQGLDFRNDADNAVLGVVTYYERFTK